MGPRGPLAVVAGDQNPPTSRQLRAPRRGRDSLQTEPAVLVTVSYGTQLRAWRRCGRLAISLVAALTLSVVGVNAVSVPAAPARVDLDVISGDEVAVAFSAPLSDGGSAVQSYEVGILSCVCYCTSVVVGRSFSWVRKCYSLFLTRWQ